MTGASGTVGALVKEAFPEGTIPRGAERSFRDFSCNFLAYRNWSTGKPHPRKKTGAEEWTQFPAWPADLFAMASLLMEKSSAYQHLANSIAPSRRDEEPDAWSDSICPDFYNESDQTGVHGRSRTILRFIGALWGHGALIISGQYHGEDLLTDRQAILRKNKLRIKSETEKDVLNFLSDRNGLEIKYGDVVNICTHVYDELNKEIGFSHITEEYPNTEAVYGKYAVSAISKIALDSLFDYCRDFTSSETSQVEREKKYQIKEHRDRLLGETLIIWGSYFIQYHWDILRNCMHRITVPFNEHEGNEDDKKWWRAAIRLLIIADEAGKGIGFSLREQDLPRKKRGDEDQILGPEAGETPPQAGMRCMTIWDYFWSEHDRSYREKATAGDAIGFIFPRTLTRCFDENLGAVLPKARTAQNGCTLRSLSLNLGFLPAKGRVRARWARKAYEEDRAAYNILLVPYPYQIKSRHVGKSPESDGRDDWGYFEIAPKWLEEIDETPYAKRGIRKPSKTLSGERVSETKFNAAMTVYRHKVFWAFLKSLIDDQPENTIHAIVLPEAALDWATFDYVQERLLREVPGIEMFVCGLTSRKPYGGGKEESGNFVATYMCDPAQGGGAPKPHWAIIHVRAKHHRWKLDSQQLRAYALSNRLSPDKAWWENIKLPPREMLFAEFSSGSILTTLICEDLARIEPCQIALRAVGPNLVLVLLMDAAQVIGRWPHQYAGVLTDDPGSSILTLTSFGLVRRSNLSETRSSREIALWREPHAGQAQQITLPKGFAAQLISIRREFGLERTLDGRGDNGDSAAIWRFAGLTPIQTSLPPPGGGADD